MTDEEIQELIGAGMRAEAEGDQDQARQSWYAAWEEADGS